MKRFIVPLIVLMCVGLINSMEELPTIRPGAKMTLWDAAETGDVKALEWHITHGQSAHIKNKNGETLLMVAAANGRQELVQKLLMYHDADVDAKDMGNSTALMHAALHGHARTVKLLIEWGANIAAEDSIGRRALNYAQNSQNEATIDLLKDAEKSLDIPVGTPPLIRAVNRGEVNTVKAMLKQQKMVNERDARGNTPLSAAARAGSLPLVELLLTNGAQVDSRNNDGLRPLHAAVMGGYLEVAKLLLDHGADVNAQDDYRGRTPLLWVGRMTKGAPKKAALQIPVEKSVQLIKLLLSRGADPARVDFEGKTALDWAIWTRYFDPRIAPLIVVLSEAMNVKPEIENISTKQQEETSGQSSSSEAVQEKLSGGQKQVAKAKIESQQKEISLSKPQKKTAKGERDAARKARRKADKVEQKTKNSLSAAGSIIAKSPKTAPSAAVSAVAECNEDMYERWYNQEGCDDASLALPSRESDFDEFEDWQDDYNYKRNVGKNSRSSDFSQYDIDRSRRNEREAQKSRHQDWYK
jgi:ankyrin repeat protein